MSSGDLLDCDFLHLLRVFPGAIHTLLLETLHRKITNKFLFILVRKSLTETRTRRLALSDLR